MRRAARAAALTPFARRMRPGGAANADACIPQASLAAFTISGSAPEPLEPSEPRPATLAWRLSLSPPAGLLRTFLPRLC